MIPAVIQSESDPLAFHLSFDLPADFVTNGEEMRAILKRYPANPTRAEGDAMERDCQALFDETACAMIRDTDIGAWLRDTGLPYSLDGSTVWGGRYVTLSFSRQADAMLFKLRWG